MTNNPFQELGSFEEFKESKGCIGMAESSHIDAYTQHLKSGIERIRLAGGALVPLATKSDLGLELNSLRNQ